MYKQPSVPVYRGEKITEYLHILILFLKDFCANAWLADKTKDDKLADLEKRIKALEGGV